MSAWEAIVAELSDRGARGLSAAKRRPVSGGCIHDAQHLEGDPPLFVKVNVAAQADLFDFEAEGLEALGASDTVRVPRVFARGVVAGHAYLALEWLDLVPLDARSGARLGSELAGLHRALEAQGRFGFPRDNALGTTPQRNAWSDTWPGFWRDRRLAPLVRALEQRGSPIAGAVQLLEIVPALLEGHDPQPALLHGDLWGGNAAALADGTPVIFDPATYWGDPETDLAMARLFGGFPAAFHDAWDREHPSSAGRERRIVLYQLYHLLNHALLFGGSYGSQAARSIRQLLA